MKQQIKQKGFIQIPLLLGIIIAIVVASGIGVGVFLHRQDKAKIYEKEQELIIEEEQAETEEEEDGEKTREETKNDEEKVFYKDEPTEFMPSIVVSTPTPTPTPKSTSSPIPNTDIKISSITIISNDNFLRIGWSVDKPSESSISVYPAHEIFGGVNTTSTLKASFHYVDILYSEMPVYSLDISPVDDYLKYNYRIKAITEESSASKDGGFTLKEEIDEHWVLEIMMMNKELPCDSFSTFNGVEKLFCKNYRIFNYRIFNE